MRFRLGRPVVALGFGLSAWLLVGVGVWAAAAPAATVGELTYQGCIGNEINPDCAPMPGPMLNEVVSVAVDPAGDSLYAASGVPGALSVFSRSATGALAFDSCLSSAALAPCVDLEGDPLQIAVDVAVSPDGASVYGLGRIVDTVVHLLPAVGGGLTFDSCLARAVAVCGPLADDPMPEPTELAFSPDGISVYVVSFIRNSILHFTREAGGELAFRGCLAAAAAGGCAGIPGSPLEFPQQVAVTPDGRFVYVIGQVSSSILRFARDPAGHLTFEGCLTDRASIACDLLPREVLGGLQGLAISPDGRSLYVTGEGDDTVVHFAIEGDGELSFASCLIAEEPAEGCTAVPEESLQSPRELAISPDGRSVYVDGSRRDTVIHLARDPVTGGLTFDSCLIDPADPDSDQGCVEIPGGDSIFNLQDLVVSPDGKSVYAADFQTDSILTFARFPGDPPPPPPGRPPLGPEQPKPAPPSCAGKRATIVGTPRADRLRGTPRPDVIAGLGGADTIRGRGGKDLICGGPGRDKLRGGPGKDTLFGGGGADRCQGGPARDRVTCERGRKP